MRSRVWVVIDCSMLVVVIALQAWRLTGVPLHEWLAIGLLAAVVAAQARVNYALNLTLFLSMTAAMAISKVVLPLHLTPDEYLKWHGIHEFSSRVALACAALHLALNWDRLFVRRPRFRALTARVATIAVAIVIVSTAVYAIDRVMPRPDIMLITRDGRRIEHPVAKFSCSPSPLW